MSRFNLFFVKYTYGDKEEIFICKELLSGIADCYADAKIGKILKKLMRAKDFLFVLTVVEVAERREVEVVRGENYPLNRGFVHEIYYFCKIKYWQIIKQIK